MRWLKWGIGGLLCLGLIAGGVVMAFSWRVAHEVASVERTIVVPLPTVVAVATAAPTVSPTSVATVNRPTPTAPTTPTAPPAPTATAVAAPNAGQVLRDGVKAAVNEPDGHEAVWKGQQYVHILLLGLDRRDDEPTRSDTMIIVTVDLWDGVASMLSIPRDLVVPIPGHGEDRVNAAYVYGQLAHPNDPVAGPALAVQTVSRQFKVPIEHYLQVDFNGFRGAVDAVGGVDINVTETIDDPEYPTDDYGYKHIHFDPACYHMGGEQALEYARTRHSGSDDQRRDRQMQVMQAVLDRTGDLDAARRLPEIVKSLGASVQTSIPWEGQLSLARMSRRINATGVQRFSIGPPMVRPTITRYGAWVYIGDWPAIGDLVREATDPKRPIQQDRPTTQESGTHDLTNASPAPRCGAR
ncbi:MAG: LCP family protein [Chloroflexota bacterium]|nr:LCP family protein [Chloroflexota bacterium]